MVWNLDKEGGGWYGTWTRREVGGIEAEQRGR